MMNKLTEELFSQGYTEESYPSYVRPYDKYEGGFTYKNCYLENLVFVTNCGLQVKGREWEHGDLGYMGIDWKPENDNPTVKCPFHRKNCDLNHPYLRGGFFQNLIYCDCHLTMQPFDYEKSIDKVLDEIKYRKEKKFREFSEQKKGHVCRHHMIYDEVTETWRLKYYPVNCAKYCSQSECELRHTELSTKRGNVFYDLKTTWYRHDDTVFNGEKYVSIIKGKRFLKTPCSMSICEEIVKRNSSHILEKEELRLHADLFFHKDMSIEVINIRAESRESRDLMQDLEDIKAGIRIYHESDSIKADKEYKSQKHKERATKNIKKLEKKIVRGGLDNLSICEKKKVDKFIDKNRVQQLLDETNKAKSKPIYRQLTIDEMVSSNF